MLSWEVVPAVSADPMNAVMDAHIAARRTVRTRTPIPADVEKLLVAGKLEKACPVCGTWEAASFYCSKCGRRSTPAEWYRNGDLTARRATLQMAAENRPTPHKQGRGRPRRVSAPGTLGL